MSVKDNLIQDRSFDFALAIVDLYKKLIDQKEYVLSKQLLRSGTSIGANVEEVIAAYSRNDFLHKINLSLKEARESRFWLRLLNESDLTSIQVTDQLAESEEMIRILSAIVKTTRDRIDKF